MLPSCTLALLLSLSTSDGKPPEPWRLQRALALPSWLELRVEQRTRFERRDGDFRTSPYADELFALRTRVAATAHMDSLRVGAELQDSRQYGADDDRRLSTADVNAVELLQGYVGLRVEDAIREGDELDFLLGRHTMDVGSRRLVARNRFRNTTNAFTGLNVSWKSGSSSLRAFYVLPVQRLPRGQDDLHDNEIEFDEEDDRTRFAGLHGATTVAGLTTEAYAFGLDEDDSGDVATRNREIWTLGARVYTDPEPGTFDFEWESAFQFGDSRSSTSALDTTDLDHRARFHHLSVGYLFAGQREPHLELLFDYASGDDDPDDDENNRFDTLYGARRFEFGPTGIHGAFARSNIVSPGARFTFKPAARTQLMLAHRLFYLASDRDAWTTSGLRDPDGTSGDHIGQQAEVRLRHDVVPKTLRVELGLAHLFSGSFVRDAPNATGQDDVTYGYVSTNLTF